MGLIVCSCAAYAENGSFQEKVASGILGKGPYDAKSASVALYGNADPSQNLAAPSIRVREIRIVETRDGQIANGRLEKYQVIRDKDQSHSLATARLMTGIFKVVEGFKMATVNYTYKTQNEDAVGKTRVVIETFSTKEAIEGLRLDQIQSKIRAGVIQSVSKSEFQGSLSAPYLPLGGHEYDEVTSTGTNPVGHDYESSGN